MGVGSWKVVGDVVVVLLLASILRGIKDPEGKSPSIPGNSPLLPPVDFVPGFGVGAKTNDISIWLGAVGDGVGETGAGVGAGVGVVGAGVGETETESERWERVSEPESERWEPEEMGAGVGMMMGAGVGKVGTWKPESGRWEWGLRLESKAGVGEKAWITNN